MSKSNLILWSLKNRNFKEIATRIGDLIIGWLIRPISFITPRNRKKWLIGNKTGWGDNSKYLRIFLEQNNLENLRIIWIAKSKAQRDIVKSKGFEAYSKWSFKGVYHALTAGAFIFSSNISDINYWASGKAFRLNMWHGVGLKKLGMKMSKTYNPKDWSTHILTPFYYNQPNYFVGPSDMMARHFADCYRMEDKQMLKVGYPRCDFLLLDKKEARKIIDRYESQDMINLIEKISSYSKVYIYMPTFRDDQHDFIKESGWDFDKINEILSQQNALLLLKLHPATRLGDFQFSHLDNIIEVDKNLDVYPILKYTDILITDYSSIYYDYILMEDKDVILFPFDYEEYIGKSRDFAFDYLTYAPGVKAWNFQELYDTISGQKDLSFKDRDAIIETFWGKNYHNSSEKIKRACLNELK